MVEAHNIIDYCMSKACVYESRPFGELPICYRVGGKIFAQFNPNADWYKITLKTNPEQAYAYRELFPGQVVRGWHCPPVQQPYWNTVSLEEFPEDVLFTMIDEAYNEVVKSLTKKQQRRLLELADYEFIKTTGEDPSFAELCQQLDDCLEEIVRGKFDRSQYRPYNLRNNIQDVILVKKDGVAIGCAAYKFYDEETVEMKRVFVNSEYRGRGIGRELLMRLEADARIQGYRYMILESGELLESAMATYRRMKYHVIPNYGPYADMPDSVCMSKKL